MKKPIAFYAVAIVLLFSRVALADVTYSYVGPAYNACGAPADVCANYTNTSITLTFASALPSSAPTSLISFLPLSVRFSNGVEVGTDLSYLDPDSFIATDADGLPTTWDLEWYGPNYLSFMSLKGLGFEDLTTFSFCSGGPSVCEGSVNVTTTSATGYWTESSTVPEPSSLMLLGSGVLGLFGPIRRKLLPRWK